MRQLPPLPGCRGEGEEPPRGREGEEGLLPGPEREAEGTAPPR